ncbi:peptidoglycan editing factor PgeF [Swingsia samuiensis]|uniref:Purine nucleoside phosphorylase n=1 Tax=Swingsia samuiensis TaxID=1293412 RepID=A0A4Y6UHI1_9PROT|nr:peptidoglycan editing factor PgeF [Swingsia samuiensis]QDH16962.1 peptidoglycan editing factor PgeF [Swingsia samuiensis]
MSEDVLKSALLPMPHGFFTRRGGVSPAPYDSLNCSFSSQDEWDNIVENRARVAQSLQIEPTHLMGLKQTHSNIVVAITSQTDLWPLGKGQEGDALVTNRPDVGVSVITADCGPILLRSDDGRIVGAAHAGWRGAVGGVLEATISKMHQLGAQNIVAAIGPCIGSSSYEVAEDMRNTVLAAPFDGERFFTKTDKKGHYLFDLAGYCAARLKNAGAHQIDVLSVDTLHDQRFFSHRRRTLAGGGNIGHQISAIRPRG